MPRTSKPKKDVFGPAFNDDTMYRIEKVSASQEMGQTRRLVLTICARSSDNSLALANLGKETFARTLDAVKTYEQHIGDLHRIAQSAVTRLELVAPVPIRKGKAK